MSRSYRKTPIFGNCGNNGSEKKDKTICNKTMRHINTIRLLKDLDIFMIKDEAFNKWAMNKDGKHYRTKFENYKKEMSK